jgi:hypothetical protein
MIRYIAALIFLLSEAHGQVGDAPATVVHVTGWTTTGERLEKIWVGISSFDGREKYTGTGRDVDLAVPTGEYILQVEAPGFQTKRQILKAYQPVVFRSVSLPVARIHGQGTPSLTGVVRNYDGDIRDLRVRLIGLYGTELREAVLDSHAAFSFPVDEGAYLLVVIADLEKALAVIDSLPLRIVGQETIVIDLKGKHGTILQLRSGTDHSGAGRN